MDEEGCLNQRSSSRGKKSGDEDVNEEDIWAVNFMKDREVSSNWKAKRALEYYSSSSRRRIPAVPVLPKVIPRVISVGHHLQQPVIITHHQSSAPLRIPDWSNVVDCTTTTSLGAADAWSVNNSNSGYSNYTAVNEINVEDDDEDVEEMVPPHEFIARRLARSPVVSCSMCEGVGRTLKGRDLSKLRNAILTKTGFLE